MMKMRLVALIVLIACIISGCFGIEQPYTFRQEFDQIVSIEILKKEYDSMSPYAPMDVIKTIPPSQHQEIIDALLKAGWGRNAEGAGTGFGMYVVCITYKDGEMEMLGTYNTGYITPDGELHQDVYMFDRKEFYEIISYYLEEVITPPTLE